MRENIRFLCAFRLDCEGLIAGSSVHDTDQCGQCIMPVKNPSGILGTRFYTLIMPRI